MNNLTLDQLQSILDSYSKGKIIDIYPLKDIFIEIKNPIVLFRNLVETKQGLFLIVTDPNDILHDLWWSSKPKDYAAKLAKALKLKNEEILQREVNVNTLHRFDLRISVFAL